MLQMHSNSSDHRALEREALRNVINQWNANRLDLFELSEPNEDLEFHGVMRFYFQDSGQKVATKCIRVASDATVEDVIGTLVEKFRPDMRMLSIPSYALYELHEGYPERKMEPHEKPLLVQLNWHVDDREGRFLLKNIDDEMVNCIRSIESNASFRRKLSRREKKQQKKQEKLCKMISENLDITDKDGVAEKLYTELPETLFTRSISNPEAVMRRRRQQKLEKKLQQFRSKDGGPDTGGTLKIYGESLCKDVPYKTLLLSIRDTAGAVVKEMLDKYGFSKTDPSQWCLVQVTQQSSGSEVECILDDDECPLSILMNSSNSGSIMFHVRRRPADCAPRKRKKKPGALGTHVYNTRETRSDSVPFLVELGPDGSVPHPGDTTRTICLNNEVMEVGSANGIALQLYGPHIQPRHCVIKNTDGVVSLTPCHADAHTYVNGQRIHQTTLLSHGSLVKFGHSNTYQFLDPVQEDRTRQSALEMSGIYDNRLPRALSPTELRREHVVETTFDLEGNVETVSTTSGTKEDNRSLVSVAENRLSGIDHPQGQDPILPAVLEFPEESQEQFLARVITHLDITMASFRLAPAYALYLCARYRASTHYRPELTPTERAYKLTVLLQHIAILIHHTVQDRSTEITSQAFWLANSSELLHFLKSDRHIGAFSLQAQDTLADSVQLAFKNIVAHLTDELKSVLPQLMSVTGDDNLGDIIGVLCGAMSLMRKCRVNAALTIQLFSHLFHWMSTKALSNVIRDSNLCTKSFGVKLFNRLRSLQIWAESQGLELAAECHLAKIMQCAHLLQAPKSSPEELANLSAACFKLNSVQLGTLLMQYKAEPGEKLASHSLLEQAGKAAESVADELARAEGREVTLHEEPGPPLQLILPDDGFSCEVIQGVPPSLIEFLQPLQASGLCRLATQPTSSGHWTVYMLSARPQSALSSSQPEVQVIRLHKEGGGMGLSIVAAKGTGQERLGIYIKSVVPGGAADKNGRLSAGDQLLAVDGQSLLGITQEKAAEILVKTGNVVTLEVAKGGAVYHGLATALLQHSSTTSSGGHRQMSEHDLPSRVDAERTIPSSKSVPALHHISSNPESCSSRDMFNPSYSRTSSSNSININSVTPSGFQSGSIGSSVVSAIKSRSVHNLTQQDGGFYQNLSIYRNKMPSPQHLDRNSALRCSQTSLHPPLVNSQRPSSTYYPSSVPVNQRSSLHQSIPNLKSSSSTYRLQNNEGSRTGTSSNMAQTSGINYSQSQTIFNCTNQNSPYNVQQNNSLNNYESYRGQNLRDLNNSYTVSTHSGTLNYSPGSEKPLRSHANHANGFKSDEKSYEHSAGGKFMRGDVVRYSQADRHEEIMKYPSSSNILEAQIQQNKNLDNKQPEMSIIKNDGISKQYAYYSQDDISSYANSNNMKFYEGKGESLLSKQNDDHHSEGKICSDYYEVRHGSNLRGQAKMLEISEEVKRRQNRILSPFRNTGYNMWNSNIYQLPHNLQMLQNTQSLQNLNLSQHKVNSTQHSSDTCSHSQYGNNPNTPALSNYKSPPVAPKPMKKQEDIPQLPPTNTHPLYSASMQDLPKMSLYAVSALGSNKNSREPWSREEQERQAEVRREAAKQWQEEQIRELAALQHRTPQQEEQLRVLQLEKEFQRRAQEAAENDDDDTEKESPSPHLSPSFASELGEDASIPSRTSNVTDLASGLRDGDEITNSSIAHLETPSVNVMPPPPPERGSSFTVMSIRNKENMKRVSFNDASSEPQPPHSLQIVERIKEDPNNIINQADVVLTTSVTPTSQAGSTPTTAIMTPGVIGAQEIYKDPRAKRLAEQAQQKNLTIHVPEKLSFKEKMKMFAMETGEQETPKDKSKISRAQREIDNLRLQNIDLSH